MRFLTTLLVVLLAILARGSEALLDDAAKQGLLAPNRTSNCLLNVNLEWTARVGSSIVATPRIVDLMHNGQKQVLIPTFSQFLEALSGATGEDVPRFPFMHPKFKSYASPLPIDMDGDGKTEWLVAMYNGQLAIFGEDGNARGIIQVPPLSVKKQWMTENFLPEEAAVMRTAKPLNKTAQLLAEALRARRVIDLERPPIQVERHRNLTANSIRSRQLHQQQQQQQERLVTPSTENQRDDFDTKLTGLGNEEIYERREDRDDPFGENEEEYDELDDDFFYDEYYEDEEATEGVDAPGQIGTDGRLSPEALRAMELLYHPENFMSQIILDAETDVFSSRHLRGGPVLTVVTDDELAVPAHLLSTPVVVDVDGNGDLDAVLHVSYFFDATEGEKPDAAEGSHVNPDNYVATAVVCMNLITGEVRWSHVLHLGRKNDPSPPYAFSTPLVVNPDEDSSLEIYVTSTSGSIVALSGKGTVIIGWPVRTPPISASAAAESVTGDGALRICVGDVEGTVRCFRSDGTVEWERTVVGSVAERVSFGDINGDGVMDVVFGTSVGYIYALSGKDGSVLPNFPVIAGGSIVAPVLLVGLGPLLFGKELHVVVPSHDGKVYLVGGLSGCIETIDLDEKSSTMVLADDLTGNGNMDLLVTTINGGVYVFETGAQYHPLKSWPSETKGLNGYTASENFVGVYIDPEFRKVRDVRGDSMKLRFTIVDTRPAVNKQRLQYHIGVYVGTRVRLHHALYREAKSHTVLLRTPLERTYADLTIILSLPNGQVFSDTVSMSFNVHFLETIKFTLLIPFLFVTIALMLVHKRHEVEIPDGREFLY